MRLILKLIGVLFIAPIVFNGLLTLYARVFDTTQFTGNVVLSILWVFTIVMMGVIHVFAENEIKALGVYKKLEDRNKEAWWLLSVQYPTFVLTLALLLVTISLSTLLLAVGWL